MGQQISRTDVEKNLAVWEESARHKNIDYPKRLRNLCITENKKDFLNRFGISDVEKLSTFIWRQNTKNSHQGGVDVFAKNICMLLEIAEQDLQHASTNFDLKDMLQDYSQAFKELIELKAEILNNPEGNEHCARVLQQCGFEPNITSDQFFQETVAIFKCRTPLALLQELKKISRAIKHDERELSDRKSSKPRHQRHSKDSDQRHRAKLKADSNNKYALANDKTSRALKHTQDKPYQERRISDSKDCRQRGLFSDTASKNSRASAQNSKARLHNFFVGQSSALQVSPYQGQEKRKKIIEGERSQGRSSRHSHRSSAH